MVSKISIVGVDDSVCPQDLADISQTFKFVEWGINLYPDQGQRPGYPSSEWLEELLQYSDDLQLRGILHGRWESDILDGTLSFKIEKPDLWNAIDYVQVDIRNSPRNIVDVLTTCTDKTCRVKNRNGCLLCAKKIILQTNYVPTFNANILLPRSGMFSFSRYCGYSILEEDLALLCTEVKESFWVSVEGFKSNNNVTLDLSRITAFLSKAEDCVTHSSLMRYLHKKIRV
ncbi:hypothetical protein M0R72_02835 [Candidatus Pacearchaeota archaeon]|jgi:hypothetical protein|nr:hypothetical protein [Candidatus Pacearchaeota archaeon]